MLQWYQGTKQCFKRLHIHLLYHNLELYRYILKEKQCVAFLIFFVLFKAYESSRNTDEKCVRPIYREINYNKVVITKKT